MLIDSIKILFIVILLPNLILNVVGVYTYLERPLINIDFILLAISAYFYPKTLFIIASIIIIFSIDMVVSSISIFFFKLDDIFRIINNIIYINLLESTYIIFALFLTCISIIYCYIFYKLILVKNNSLSTLLITIILVGCIMVLDLVNGTSTYSSYLNLPYIPVVERNIAGSAIFNVFRALSGEVFLRENHEGNTAPKKVRSATGDLLKSVWEKDQNINIKGQHLVLVIVESLALSKKEEINRLIFEPFEDPKIRELYEVKMGEVPFSDATVGAEFRELCGLKIEYKDLADKKMPISLPSYLQGLGFRTLAIHGFRKEFFSRQDWYPQIGFERVLFFKDLIEKVKFRQCGSVFRGICDDDTAAVVQEELLTVPQGERLFLYWLTLNSHLPVSKNSAARSLLNCHRCLELSKQDEVCDLIKILHLVHNKICEIATNPNLPPTHFIVVGDHSPSFISVQNRILFKNDLVPFIEMQPKGY